MANSSYSCPYTAAQLEELSKKRLFDQIIVVVKDLKEKKDNLTNIYDLARWTEDGVTSEVYQAICASAWMNEVELKLIQPDGTASPWQTYADKYGEGICCVREVLEQKRWISEQERFSALGVKIIGRFADDTGETIVYDLLDRIGGLFAIHLDSADRVLPTGDQRNARKLCQINITTDDVDRTAADVVELLRIGPYGIGTLNNQTVKNAGLLVDGKWCCPEFSFQLAMGVAGNLEFEIIAPAVGPTVYKSYIDRRGIGYHHIKEIVSADKLDETFEGYEKKGMPLCIKGTMDITTFAYLDSEAQLGFYVELGDGLPPEKLPEGYNFYLYPEE